MSRSTSRTQTCCCLSTTGGMSSIVPYPSAEGWHTGLVIADRIVCVDCGGQCHRLTYWAEDDPPLPGDTVAYRCSDCGDRWDIVLDQEDFDD